MSVPQDIISWISNNRTWGKKTLEPAMYTTDSFALFRVLITIC